MKERRDGEYSTNERVGHVSRGPSHNGQSLGGLISEWRGKWRQLVRLVTKTGQDYSLAPDTSALLTTGLLRFSTFKFEPPDQKPLSKW